MYNYNRQKTFRNIRRTIGKRGIEYFLCRYRPSVIITRDYAFLRSHPKLFIFKENQVFISQRCKYNVGLVKISAIWGRKSCLSLTGWIRIMSRQLEHYVPNPRHVVGDFYVNSVGISVADCLVIVEVDTQILAGDPQNVP